MGGSKGGGSKGGGSKKKKTAVQKKAAIRHANFKKTVKETGRRVQTFGGTRQKYSKADARAIEQAHGGPEGFSRVTGGAANPLNRAPTTEDVKVGDLRPEIKEFSESLGNDYSMFSNTPVINYNFNERPKSDISFSHAIRANSGARFNEAGRNEVNQNIASSLSAGSGGGYYVDAGSTRGFVSKEQAEKMLKNPEAYKMRPSETRYLRESMNLPRASLPQDGKIPTRLFYNRPYDKPDVFIKDEQMKEDAKERFKGLTGIPLATTNLTGLGITPKSTGYDPGSTAYALRTGDYDPASYEKFKASQETAGGLNIGNNFGLSAAESDRLGRVFQQTPSPRMLSEGGDIRFSDMFEADTQGAKISKGINAVKNMIPIVNLLPDLKINSVAEEAQRRYLGYNPNLPSSALIKTDRRVGGGARLPLTPTVAQEVAPEYQPVPSASTTPTTQTGVDPNRLLQIQQQAYAQAYNPMLIGGFNPQFRYGAATPTIDYSTYFNY